MGSNAKPLKLRLFLEGEEVPVISASVSISLNSPASASIQIVPLDAGRLFLPRTMVHLFFLERPARATNLGNGKVSMEDYRLFFSGEVVGYSWSKSPLGRGLVLNCLDFSSYWDAAYVSAIDYGSGGNTFSSRNVSGGESGKFDNLGVNFVSQRINNWLREGSKGKVLTPGLQGLSGMAGGIVRVIEAVTGVQDKHRGINDFFTIAELRCKILEQICAEQKDNTSQNLMDIHVFDEFISNSLHNLGTEVSLRQILITLAQQVYYDFVPNPMAMYSYATVDPKDEGKARPKAAKAAKVYSLTATLRAQVRAFSGTNSHNAALNLQSAVMEDSVLLESTKSTFEQSKATYARTQLDLAFTAANTAAGLTNDSEIGSQINIVTSILGDIADHLGKDTSVSSTPDTRQKAKSHLARLQSIVFRPDCWFAAPPRCNVIFPEQYSQLNYDRTFLGETSRMLLMFYNTLIQRDGAEELLTNRVYAPFSDQKTNVKFVGKGSLSAFHILMKHERHTGIISKIKRVPNTAAPVSKETNADASKKFVGASRTWGHKIALYSFFQDRFYSRVASISGKFNPYLVAGFPALIITNPFIPDLSKVPEEARSGGALLEVIKDSESARQMSAPAHLLGMVTTLSHSMGQDGGQTSASLNYVHEHFPHGDDSFLDLFSETAGKVTKRICYTISASDFNKELTSTQTKMLSLLEAATPQGAPPSKGSKNVKLESESVVVDVDSIELQPDGQTKVVSTSNTVVRLKETQVEGVDGGLVKMEDSSSLGRQVRHPVQGSRISPGETEGLYGGKIVEYEVSTSRLLPSTSQGKYRFSSVAFYEEVELTTTKNVPIEEIIRPDWFSTSFSNVKIGEKIYQPFFGTGAIVDELLLGGAGEASVQGSEGYSVDPGTEDKDTLLQLLSDGVANVATSSTDRAVNLLAYYYGLVKSTTTNGVGLDVAEFIDNYTWRPIAGMTDVLGDNLKVDVDSSGKVALSSYDSSRDFKVGFHSMSVAAATVQKGNLSGLLQDPTTKLTRIDGVGEDLPVNGEYDVRQEKRDAVMVYKAELNKGPAFRG